MRKGPSSRRFLAPLASLALACGSRTAIDVGPVPVAVTDAGPDVPVLAAPDSGLGAYEAGCGPTWVLFTLSAIGSEGSVDSRQVYARRVDGTGTHVLPLPHLRPVSPSVSPDGTRLVYTVDTYDHVYLRRFADGTEVDLPLAGTTLDPALSPDGQWVTYDDGASVWLASTGGGAASGATPTLLVSGRGAGAAPPVRLPFFAPDSQSVLFSQFGSLGSVGLDGALRQSVLTAPASVTHVNGAWSPDRQRLVAATSCDGTTYALRTYPAAGIPLVCGDGTVVAPVSAWAAEFSRPAWGGAPGAEVLAYADQPLDVMVVDLASGATTNFTHDLTSGAIATATDPTFADGCTPL